MLRLCPNCNEHHPFVIITTKYDREYDLNENGKKIYREGKWNIIRGCGGCGHRTKDVGAVQPSRKLRKNKE